MDVQEQLAELRRKIASINRKYVGATPRRPARPEAPDAPRVFRRRADQRKGSLDRAAASISRPRSSISAIAATAAWTSRPDRNAGRSARFALRRHDPALASQALGLSRYRNHGLAGGAGTYAFLIGVGSIDEEGFRVRQFFMRDYGDEPSLLAGLAEHLSHFDVLITYNGKTYDQPLLETRYRMARARPPFARMAASGSAASARAGCGSCASTAAGWWIWKTRSWASSAKAICPAR